MTWAGYRKNTDLSRCVHWRPNLVVMSGVTAFTGGGVSLFPAPVPEQRIFELIYLPMEWKAAMRPVEVC